MTGWLPQATVLLFFKICHYGSGYPQTAFDWWMHDQVHRNEILNTRYTEMGVGYAYVADTANGGYYTVDFGSP